jgi:hypothetical protein
MPSTSNKQQIQCNSGEIFIPDKSIHLRHDDDSATSATLAFVDIIDHSSSSSPPHKAAETARTARSVKFDEERNISYYNSNVCKEDCAELWYNNEDYSHFETATEFLAIKLGRADERCKSQFSFERVTLRLYSACCQCPYETTEVSLLTLVEEAHLRHWMAESPGRLGVESLSIRLIDEDQMKRRVALVNLVCELQGMKISSPTKKADLIRQSCHVHSRPARLFARHLAQNWFHSK